MASGVLWFTLRQVKNKTTLTSDDFFLPFCWHRCLLSLLEFHSIIEWLLVIHIWHETCKNKSFYLSLASRSKFILLLQTTQEEKERLRFSQRKCCHQHQPELSVELLCIIFLGWLLNIVYLCDSGLAGKFRNVFQLGKLSFHRSVDSPKTTVHTILYHPSFKVYKKNTVSMVFRDRRKSLQFQSC